MKKIGDRVGAIIGGDAKRVELLGFGVYSGDEVPEGARGMGPLMVEAGMTNPKITLDNGDVVWGCECWWGPEAEIIRRIEEWRAAGAEIIDVRIADARAALDRAPEPDHAD